MLIQTDQPASARTGRFRCSTAKNIYIYLQCLSKPTSLRARELNGLDIAIDTDYNNLLTVHVARQAYVVFVLAAGYDNHPATGG